MRMRWNLVDEVARGAGDWSIECVMSATGYRPQRVETMLLRTIPFAHRRFARVFSL